MTRPESTRERDRGSSNRPEGESLRSLLTQYMACPRSARPPSLLRFVRERNPHVFSHHDHARADYGDHAWRCSGLYICRGCTAVFVATLVTFTVGVVTRWPVVVPTSAVAASFVVMLLLAHAPLPETPRTMLHDVRRAILGCLLGSAAAYVIICDDWVLRSVVVAVYLGVLVARRLRRRR